MYACIMHHIYFQIAYFPKLHAYYAQISKKKKVRQVVRRQPCIAAVDVY